MSEFVTGRNAVLEALRAGQRARRLLITSGSASDPSVQAAIEVAVGRRVSIETVPARQLSAIHPRHQGVVLEVEPFHYLTPQAIKSFAASAGQTALVLALDQLQDPQNLGSLLRTALAVRVTGVLIPEHRAAGISPSVVRASAGAIEHLAVARATNLGRALDELKSVGLWVAGLDPHQGTPFDEADLRGPLAVVVGSEGSGLRPGVRERCDLLLHVPMAGPTESLNAAVAGSIVLYHIFRLRRRDLR
jgi:23S rRNA (guanosine2251-2'-O)-methyltransferase